MSPSRRKPSKKGGAKSRSRSKKVARRKTKSRSVARRKKSASRASRAKSGARRSSKRRTTRQARKSIATTAPGEQRKSTEIEYGDQETGDEPMIRGQFQSDFWGSEPSKP